MSLLAQSDKNLIKKGNDDYQKKNYADAETKYRKSLEENPQSSAGSYNLGNALYQQGKAGEAIQYYSGSASMSNDPIEKAEAYFNLGNAQLKAQKYKESVDAYKEALRYNNKDEDARYNLVYALKKLKEQQKQQQQQKQEQNQDQKQPPPPKQQQEQKKQQQEQQQQQAAQQKKPKISKEDAERMLQALRNDERILQKKLPRHIQAAPVPDPEKDW
jgi:Ca-activated chloride channel homolog